MKSLGDVVFSLDWTSQQDNLVVVVDDGFAEAFKWNLTDTHIENVSVYSLCESVDNLNIIATHYPARVVVFTTRLCRDVLLKIKSILVVAGAMQSFILTSISAEASTISNFATSSKAHKSRNMTAGGYSAIEEIMHPFAAKLVYFPLHCIQLLSLSCSNEVSKLIF